MNDILNWDDIVEDIENDSPVYQTLPAGVYTVKIKDIERGTHRASAKIPECPQAVVTFEFEDENGIMNCKDFFIFSNSLAWKISNFATAFGIMKKGEKLRLSQIFDSSNIGKEGIVKLGIRHYTNNNGEEREGNQIDAFVLPTEVEEKKTSAWT